MKGKRPVGTVCSYFEKPGKRNTGAVLEAAGERAGTLGITTVLVPSVSGKTALAARESLAKNIRVIAVTHVAGF